MLFVHNLDEEPVKVDFGDLYAEADHPNQVFADQEYQPVGRLDALEVGAYGYRWIRLHRNPTRN